MYRTIAVFTLNNLECVPFSEEATRKLRDTERPRAGPGAIREARGGSQSVYRDVIMLERFLRFGMTLDRSRRLSCLLRIDSVTLVDQSHLEPPSPLQESTQKCL